MYLADLWFGCRDDHVRTEMNINKLEDVERIDRTLLAVLVKGWRFEEEGEHVRSFNTESEMMDSLDDVMPCQCDECMK